jgi:hypothetical protein
MSMQDPITGDWDAKLDAAGEEMTLVLMLEGNKVSGRMESPHGVQVLEDGEFVKDSVKFSIPSDRGEMELSGKLQGKTLAGEYSIADQRQGTWSATKR